jgi:hypothetical protein
VVMEDRLPRPMALGSPIVPFLAEGLIPKGSLMRIVRQVFWLRGHPDFSAFPFRIRRYSGLGEKSVSRYSGATAAELSHAGTHGIPYSFRPMPEHLMISCRCEDSQFSMRVALVVGC